MEAIRQQYVGSDAGEAGAQGPRGRQLAHVSDFSYTSVQEEGQQQGADHSTASAAVFSDSAGFMGMSLPTCCALMSLCFVSLFGLAASMTAGGQEGEVAELAAVQSGVGSVDSGVISVDRDSDVSLATDLDGRWHEVQSGESLKQVSARYYGSSSHWRILQVSNDVGRYPVQGTRLWIPATADAWFTQEETAVILLPQDTDAQEHTDDDKHTVTQITKVTKSTTTRP